MKNMVRHLVGALGYEVRGTRMVPRPLRDPEKLRLVEFDDLICRRMFERGQDLTFVQVGAFDGQIQDPLRKYIMSGGWSGVMVEPQPGPAAALRALYGGNDRITVLEAAVDRAPASRVFFVVDSPDAPNWAGALASFDKDVILKHEKEIPGIAEMIREVRVECVTFLRVLERLPGAELDLLQIDTEGADAFILSLFPFDRIKPAIVHFEVRHLSLEEREDCLEMLASHGYCFAASGSQDMLAVLF